MQHPLPPRPTLLGYAQVSDKKIHIWLYTGFFILENLLIYSTKALENNVQLYPKCLVKLKCDESSEIQRGLSWREQLKWDTCSFVSKHDNLYTEVKSNKRGPKTAAINLGSQVDTKYTLISKMGLHKTHQLFSLFAKGY